MPSMLEMAGIQDPSQGFLTNYMNAQNTNPPPTPPTLFGNRGPTSVVPKKAAAGPNPLRGTKVTGHTPIDPKAFSETADVVSESPLIAQQKESTKTLADMYRDINGIQLENASPYVKPLLALSDQLSGGHLATSDTSVSPQQVLQQMGAQADELAKRKQDTAKDQIALLTAAQKGTGSVTNIYGNPTGQMGPQDQYWKMADGALNAVRGDRTLNQAKLNHLLVGNIQAIAAENGFDLGDLDKLTPQQSALLRNEILKMASGGAATIAGEHQIDPNTVQDYLSRLKERWGNAPVGANQGLFNKQFIDYAMGLDTNARKNVSSRMNQILSPFQSKLQNSDYQKFKETYVDDPWGENGLTSASAPVNVAPKATINDADVQAYAKKYKIAPEQALARKVAHGGG